VILLQPNETITIITQLASLSVCVSSLEYISRLHIFKDDGLLSWQVSRLRFRWLSEGVSGGLWDVLFSYQGIVTLLFIRLTASFALLSGITNGILRTSCLGAIAISYIALALRSPYGMDGADQMSLTTFGSTFLISLAPPTPMLATGCLWFLALQICLSYLVAGFSKLMSPSWRNGSAMPGILNTRMYGNRNISNYLSKKRALSKVICWAVILFECSYPASLIFGGYVALVFLWLGIAFHLGTALIMGLNTFLLSFLAVYPSIYFCGVVNGGLYGLLSEKNIGSVF
jgi:hypothetical protein